MIRRGAISLDVVAASTVLAGMALVFGLALLPSGQPSSQAIAPSTVLSPVTQPVVQSTVPPQYVGIGSGSCATSNCHGGAGEPWNRSAFTFMQQDPHAQAFDVLFHDRSKLIVGRLMQLENLGEEVDGSSVEFDLPTYQAQLEKRCVSCHASPLPLEIKDADESLQHYTYGVSCEACHGPASQWVNEHLSSGWKKSRSSADKRAVGFNVLEDAKVAAETCVKCHIGSDGNPVVREVTHDLIAAGHPRLDFDFSAWYKSMPAHWDQSREQVADFHTQNWVQGQAAALESRFGLAVSQQARGVSGLAPWPELAHFDCFACHHALRYPSNYAAKLPPSKLPISFGGSWKVFENLNPESVRPFNDRLAGVLSNQGNIEETTVSRPALTAAQLARHLSAYSLSKRQPANSNSSPAFRSWDEAVAWYYAADAVLRDAEFAAKESPQTEKSVEMQSLQAMQVSLAALKDHLEGQLGGESDESEATISRYASPRRFVPQGIEVDSQASRRQQEMEAKLTAVRDALQAFWPQSPMGPTNVETP